MINSEKVDAFAIAVVVSMCLFLTLLILKTVDSIKDRNIEDIIGKPVIASVCYPEGCSFLVELDNQSREWIWMEKVYTCKVEKE